MKNKIQITLLLIFTLISIPKAETDLIDGHSIKSLEKGDERITKYLSSLETSQSQKLSFIRQEILTISEVGNSLLMLEDDMGYKHSVIFDDKANILDSYIIAESQCNSTKTYTLLGKNYETAMEFDFDLTNNKLIDFRYEDDICGSLLSTATCECIKKAVEACSSDTECLVLCGLTFQYCIGSITIACIINPI